MAVAEGGGGKWTSVNEKFALKLPVCQEENQSNYFLEDDNNHTIQIMFELDLASLSDGAQPSSAMDSFLSSTSKNKPLYKKN